MAEDMTKALLVLKLEIGSLSPGKLNDINESTRCKQQIQSCDSHTVH